MTETTARVEQAVKEFAGNEALFDMLDTEAAAAMLDWGMSTVRTTVSKTAELDDQAAEAINAPQLKLVRQSLRSIGNWAAGQYTDPLDRAQLREKLLENLRVIYGDDALMPSPEDMDRFLSRADDESYTPRQLILGLRALLEGAG
jgi:hypothetical protein